MSELVALPGYWRPDPLSEIFSPCSAGFQGTFDIKKALAEGRCCPVDTGTNGSKCTNLTFTKPDEQCLDGYTGALCLVCADGWVPQGEKCVECEGGAQIMLAFVALLVLCGVVFVGIVIILACSVDEEKVEEANGVMGQVKIMIAYLQIMSSMPGVMESVRMMLHFVNWSDNNILLVF